MTLPPSVRDENADDLRERFAASGHLVLPGLLPDDLCRRLLPEVDHWVDRGLRERSIASSLAPDRHGPPPLVELEMPAHAELLTFTPLLERIAALMGGPFVHHHLHSARHGPDTEGKPWHHDREPHDGDRADLLMVHALHYPAGLDATMGHLAVLPGSHRERAGKTARAHLGTAVLPGETVIADLPPGSTVLLDSALFHARRAVPHRGAGRDRYFIDASYCQVGGRWRPAKPHWRDMLRRARRLELGGDRWPELFAERHFTEYSAG
ncbi:phytanoyl-CoA dioxygenase [Nocardiopsis sp. NPDC006139]|uniref:phytanoyl-CoA dioxygenase n=1 Tax=unclassified Nocardiopsis TaxID=2649073 RepID=UPI0033BE50E1